MGLQKLGVAVGCLVLLAGSFAAGFTFLQSRSGAEPRGVTNPPASAESAPRAPAVRDEPDTVPPEDQEPPQPRSRPGSVRATPTARQPEDQKPAVQDTPTRSMTCAEATRLGAGCVGARVAWVGKWTHSHSATVNRKKGSEHIFNTQGPQGDFSFDYPFIVEDPNPLEMPAKGEHARDLNTKRYGPKRVVTVTGTISRVVTLNFIGKGIRHDVPVLCNVKMTINP